MAGVTLTVEGLKGLDDLRRLLNPQLADKAQAMALKQSMKAAKRQAAKDIAGKFTIKSRTLTQDGEIKDPVFAANGATIKASATPRTLNQFVFNPGRRGGPQPGLGRGKGWGKPSKPGRSASFKVLKGRGLTQAPTAFKAKGIPFIRINNTRGKGSLRVMHGPSVARIFTGKGKFSAELKKNATDAIATTFEKVVNKVYDDAARGYGVK
jgi:hypothetical protein